MFFLLRKKRLRNSERKITGFDLAGGVYEKNVRVVCGSFFFVHDGSVCHNGKTQRKNRRNVLLLLRYVFGNYEGMRHDER
jgi:hypothetical protein